MSDIRSDLKRILFERPMTMEEIEHHEEAGEDFHVPAIVHRTGRVSAKQLNTCGICGAQIVPTDDGWIAVTDEHADRLRSGAEAKTSGGNAARKRA